MAARISASLGLVVQDEDIVKMAGLATHVFGEHLGQWEKGVSFLSSLRNVPAFAAGGEGERAIARSMASLRVAGGDSAELESFSVSDRIRILAVAASALSERDTKTASELFSKAAALARAGLPKEDPANRALAVTGNNLACTFEEQSVRTPEETALMIQAARAGREYWAIAGNWLHIERAEYRLSRSYLAAGRAAEALSHARECLDIVGANGSVPLETFFGYEALALAEKAMGNRAALALAVEQMQQQFEKLSDDDKSWCEATLRGLANA